MAERSDITLDFEQFIRIYNFEKNRSATGKSSNLIFPGGGTNTTTNHNTSMQVGENKRQENTKISKSFHRNAREKSFISSPVNNSNDNTFVKRPLSSFGREI